MKDASPMNATTNRPKVLLFDVNETLLDLAPLKASVNDVLQDPHGSTLWFTTLLQYSLVLTVNEQYATFQDIGAATLQMLARNRDITLKIDDAKSALSVMKSLPPHSDVAPALEKLKKMGFRLATLTNSSQTGIDAQLEFAGLSHFFERALSVESVRKYKPHKDVYEWAVRELGVDPNDCMMVAAHGWDVAGARWAGLRTAFIARPGQQLFPLAEAPDLDCSDLAALCDRLANAG